MERQSQTIETPTPVIIQVKQVELDADLLLPENPQGVVLFAHGSGSSRQSSRNRFVAHVLHDAGFATVLMDLLTSEEEDEDRYTGHLRFDIPFLAGRLVRAAEWVKGRPETKALKLGLFGASTGGGAALVAAAEAPDRVAAVVSRGGRPDLAGEALEKVQAPTLLLVGSRDEPVISMNRAALTVLKSVKRLDIIDGATHLFEEPGTLEKVAGLASKWFRLHLAQ